MNIFVEAIANLVYRGKTKLTVGKKYEVEQMGNRTIVIVDDSGNHCMFTKTCLYKYFKNDPFHIYGKQTLNEI